MRTSKIERDHSAKAITPNKNKVIKDTISSVNSLWLSSTRSYTCSMYKVGVSISKLTTMLKTATVKNSRLKDHITVDSGSRTAMLLFVIFDLMRTAPTQMPPQRASTFAKPRQLVQTTAATRP